VFGRDLRCLDKDRYSPRTYIYCTGDTMSLKAAHALEGEIPSPPSDYTFLELPRARKVAQSMVSSAISSAWTLSFAFWYLVLLPSIQGSRRHARDFGDEYQGKSKAEQASNSAGVPFDALLLNGPGTSVTIVLACYVAKVSKNFALTCDRE
jgi:beta-1,4-N-acetylglucosaminyltransferase